jgi:hypothetical protein
MTTRECYLWMKKRREQLEPVDRPNIPLEDLIREEGRRSERIGLLLSQRFELPQSPEPDDLDRFLMHERLFHAERLLAKMMLPGSPCRVQDWSKPRYIWWLLGVSWICCGVDEWRERERLRAAFPPGSLAE